MPATAIDSTGSSNLRKYQTGNPVVQFLIRRFLQRLIRELSALRPEKILDLGCGEGIVAEFVLKHLDQVQYVGCDQSASAIREAERRNPSAIFRRADIFDVASSAESAGVIVCLEVLEHVEDTDRFLKHIAGLRPQCAILSVPWEPFFRIGNLCRGRDLRRLGNHPEHVHCFNAATFRSALARNFSGVRIGRSFPWLFGICRPNSNS